MRRSARISTTAGVALLLALGGSCAAWFEEPPRSTAADYVAAAVTALRKGQFDQAEDLLFRAQGRDSADEVTLRWLAELQLMRWREDGALDLLVELTRAASLETVTEGELRGQIGDLLFRLGRWGESVSYLRSGRGADPDDPRRAKAFVTLGLPYARREFEVKPTSIPLFAETWPAMLCSFGDKDRVCILDTGSSMSALALSLAQDVGTTDICKFGEVSDSLGKRHPASIGVSPPIAIGGLSFGKLPILVLPDERLALRDETGGAAEAPMGVIGLDVLSRFRFVLDMAQRSARLEPPAELVSRSVETCLAVEGCLALPVLVDGVTMWFILDTAASHSSLTNRGLQRLPGGHRRATPDFRSLRSLGGTFLSKKVGGIILQTSGVKFTDVEMPVVDRKSHGVFPIHGVFGIDLLRNCRMTLVAGQILLEQVETVTTGRTP